LLAEYWPEISLTHYRKTASYRLRRRSLPIQLLPLGCS
jgi:hypothetical protein